MLTQRKDEGNKTKKKNNHFGKWTIQVDALQVRIGQSARALNVGKWNSQAAPK